METQAEGFDLSEAIERVFRGPMAVPDGARLEGLSVRFDGEGGMQIERGILRLPKGSNFNGTVFPNGGSVTFGDGQSIVSDEGGI